MCNSGTDMALKQCKQWQTDSKHRPLQSAVMTYTNHFSLRIKQQWLEINDPSPNKKMFSLVKSLTQGFAKHNGGRQRVCSIENCPIPSAVSLSNLWPGSALSHLTLFLSKINQPYILSKTEQKAVWDKIYFKHTSGITSLFQVEPSQVW